MKKLISLLAILVIFQMGFAQLDAGDDITICKGEIIQLNASGGSNYTWISIPYDPTLSDPSIPNPTVKPDETTMYIVESREVGINKLLNGSFTMGNTGFTSEYINNQVSIWNPGTYAIVDDAGSVHANFFCDEDHTTGSGLMMCVNGASTPNVEVWTTTLVNIDPDTEHEFSTWVSSLSPISPATLQFRINGQLLGNPFNASFLPCVWNQFFETWNSGTGTTATISIVNQNTSSNGNDFSLDDISFAEVTYLTDTVMVYVIDPPTSGFETPDEICSSDTAIVEYTGNGADTSTYHWDFDGAAIISGSGQGPFELQWDTPGTKEISLWVEHACASDTSLHQIKVNQSPTAGITADNISIPFGTYTTLHGEMVGNPGSLEFVWEPASQLIDPASIEPQTVNLEISTQYIFYVTDMSSLCSASDTILIEVTGGALAITSLTASPDTICEGEETTLELFVEGGTGDYTATWTSDPPGFNYTGPDLTIPVSPSETITYKVTVDDNFNTTPESTIQVVVNKQIQLTDQPDDVQLIPGANAVFEVISENVSKFQWQLSTDDGGSWNDLVDDATYSGSNTNILTVAAVDEGMDGWFFRCLLAGDCNPVNSDEAQLNIIIAPNVSNELESQEVCEGNLIKVSYTVANFIQITELDLSLNFNDTYLTFVGLSDVEAALESNMTAVSTGGEIVVTWSSSQAVTLSDGIVFYFEFESIESGSSDLSWQESACSMTNIDNYSPVMVFTNSTIVVNPLATPPDNLLADPDSLNIIDEIEIELIAEGGFGDELIWTSAECEGNVIGSGTPLSIQRPEETTDYFAHWVNGCGQSSCQKVTVVIAHEFDVYAPNAFTPNNDGLNDKFELICPADLHEFHLMIFDRWGAMIFESENLYEGWDGTVGSTSSPPGTYVWKASYRLRREGKGSESTTMTGTVVLVK